MGLDVSVVCSEKLFCFAGGGVFHSVNVYAAAVIAVFGEAFCVLVCKKVAHCGLYVERAVVFACYEL